MMFVIEIEGQLDQTAWLGLELATLPRLKKYLPALTRANCTTVAAALGGAETPPKVIDIINAEYDARKKALKPEEKVFSIPPGRYATVRSVVGREIKDHNWTLLHAWQVDDDGRRDELDREFFED